jgi:hypothetical protein
MVKEWVMNWKELERNRSWTNIEVLFQYSPGGTEKNHENPQSGWPVSEPGLEPETCHVRSTNVNHSTTVFRRLKSGTFPILFIFHRDRLSYLRFLVVFLSPCRHMPGYFLKLRPPLLSSSFASNHSQYVPLKRRSTTILHGSTSQKTILNDTV